MVSEAEIIGLIAGILTTGAFLPQIMQVFTTKSADDFSYSWLSMTIIGLSLWLMYGLLISSFPIVFFNFLTIMFLFVIFYYKYSGRKGSLTING